MTAEHPAGGAVLEHPAGNAVVGHPAGNAVVGRQVAEAEAGRPGRARTTSCGDDGFATVWAAGAVLVLVTLLVLGLHLAAATSGRHRAEAAADLAALAGAVHAVDGEPVACAYAARVARRMAVQLLRCQVQGWEVLVETGVRPALALPGTGTARGRARAGPAAG